MWTKCKKAIESKYNVIYRFVRWNIVDQFWHLKWFFKNCWYYRKFLANDFPWDNASINTFLKLRTERFIPISEKSLNVNSPKITKRLKIVHELVKRFEKDEIHYHYEDEIKRLDMLEPPEYRNGGLRQMLGIRSVAIPNAMVMNLEEYKKARSSLLDKCERKRKADFQLFLHYFEKTYHFWD